MSVHPPCTSTALNSPGAAERPPQGGSTHIPDVAHLRPGEDLLGGRVHRVALPLLGHERHQLRGQRRLSGAVWDGVGDWGTLLTSTK